MNIWESSKRKLIAARALIDTPEKWTQGATAKDKDGRITNPVAGRGEAIERPPVCFCAFGACAATGANPILLDTAVGGNIVTFNDAPGRTHAEVLSVFDKAISLL